MLAGIRGSASDASEFMFGVLHVGNNSDSCTHRSLYSWGCLLRGLENGSCRATWLDGTTKHFPS
jgi:hypothetical protein